MSSFVLLSYYCLLISTASIAGGMVPVWIHLTHQRMEVAVSFVAGVMLGVGLLHMLPHAIEEAMAATPGVDIGLSAYRVMLWVLVGMLIMFFVERFFCFHHHDVEPNQLAIDCHQQGDAHDHGHDITWSGAAMGLTLHSIFAGVALAASVAHGHGQLKLAGLGTFLVILLHKPFDSMTIGMLMARGGWPLRWRHLVNGLFSLTIPLGALLFHAGQMQASGHAFSSSPMASSSPSMVATPWIDEAGGSLLLAYALAFSAGIFLCIALSDLLPELQFHHHDRVKLSIALLLGLGLAYMAGQLEQVTHQHTPSKADRRAITVNAARPTATLIGSCRPELATIYDSIF